MAKPPQLTPLGRFHLGSVLVLFVFSFYIFYDMYSLGSDSISDRFPDLIDNAGF